MASPLENAVQFLVDFGFFDVVLPFLLIFTLVFAVLEKTKIFGTEGEKKLPKKNIDAMIAFVIALFFVATPKVVKGIQVSLPQVAMFLVLIMSVMMLFGFFAAESKEGVDLWERHKGWKIFLGIVIGLSIVSIFLNAFEWLNPIIDYVADNFKGTFITSLIFLGLVVWIIYWVMHSPKGAEG